MRYDHSGTELNDNKQSLYNRHRRATSAAYLPASDLPLRARLQLMNLLGEAHLRRIYAQGAPAVVRLVHRLADRITELEAQPAREPQPVIAALAKELAKAKRTLDRRSQELLERCALSPATIQRAGRFSSGKLVRSEQRLKAAIRDSSVVGADETGLRVAGSKG